MDNSTLNLSQYLAAVGGLGTAAYGLVDASKLVRGGPSNHGFQFVSDLVEQHLFKGANIHGGLKVKDLLGTLKANWLNGVPLEDQKSKAKTLVKLMLNHDTYASLAAAAGINPADLKKVADACLNGTEMDGASKNIFGRFDLVLTALLDQAYQRADQKYRNAAKGWAMVVSTLLGLAGAWLLHDGGTSFWDSSSPWAGLLTGLLATPLAPVAKDLSSAVTAAMQAVQLKSR